jgi:hypothetical protein
MLHDVLGGKLWEWPAFEYPGRADPDHRGVRLYHRLAAAAAAQKPGEIALTDAQVHAFHEALRERPRAQADRARIVEAVIPQCLEPVDDAAFAKLLAASGLGRKRKSASSNFGMEVVDEGISGRTTVGAGQPRSGRASRAVRLTDGQLALVMTAAGPLQRIAGQLRVIGYTRVQDADVERAIKRAIVGLLHGAAA